MNAIELIVASKFPVSKLTDIYRLLSNFIRTPLYSGTVAIAEDDQVLCEQYLIRSFLNFIDLENYMRS